MPLSPLPAVCLSAFLAGFLAARWGTASGDELTRARFERLHAALRPQPGETPWLEIPWLTRLTEAREKAAREGKPLLVWIAAGGGHPLTVP